MAVTSAYADMVAELFAPLGETRWKRMFGGAGVYANDLMFALIADDVLYLKADEENAARFDAEGLEAFSYEMKDGKRGVMAYRRAPDDVFDDPDAAQEWGRLGYDAALRAAAKKKRKKR